MITIKHRRLVEASGDPVASTDKKPVKFKKSAEATYVADFMTFRERCLKQQLVNLLIDDGNGNKHGAFAEILRTCFSIRIIPFDEDPKCTAWCDAERAIIGIGEGFLNITNVSGRLIFKQLNVIIRHELSHALMKHQVRMFKHIAKKLSKEAAEEFKMSGSIHSIFNIIADDEISNFRYLDAEDKEIVRKMVLNGEIISGLVTEDHRANWTKMRLEEMFEEAEKEIEADKAELERILASSQNVDADVQAWAEKYNTPVDATHYRQDPIYKSGRAAWSYVHGINEPSSIIDIDKWMKNSKEYKNLPQTIKDRVTNFIDEYRNKSQNELDAILADIAKSGPFDQVRIKLKGKDALISIPEEKMLFIRLINSFKGNVKKVQKVKIKRATHSKEYIDEYNKTIKAYNKTSTKDFDDFLDELEKSGAFGNGGGAKGTQIIYD